MNIHHEAEKEANKRHQEEKWIETAIKVRKEKEERAKTQEQRRQQYEALKQEFEKE